MQLKKGTTRYCFIFNSIVVKIPSFDSWKLFLNGLLGNMQETLFWSMKLEKMCPILFSLPGGFLNIMPYCEPLSEDEFERLNISWFECIPVEEKIDSFGKYNGRIVAIDYGS